MQSKASHLLICLFVCLFVCVFVRGSLEAVFWWPLQDLFSGFLSDLWTHMPCVQQRRGYAKTLPSNSSLYSPPPPPPPDKNACCGVWLLDLSLSWHFLCPTLSDLLRLAAVHLGLFQWPYAFTPYGLSPHYEVGLYVECV